MYVPLEPFQMIGHIFCFVYWPSHNRARVMSFWCFEISASCTSVSAGRSSIMLELHIYGSAFDLPSVEIECLAAVALLRCSFQDDEAWSLVPSNNPNVSPYGELPALRDGNLWVAGFPLAG